MGGKWEKTLLAKRIYEVLFEYFSEGEMHGYQVYFPAIPGIVTWGRTLEEAEANAKEALECHIEGMTEAGESIP